MKAVASRDVTWNSSSVASAWNAASSSVSACMSVSGTYFPPNLPNLPIESGLAIPATAAPFIAAVTGASAAATALAGCIAATATAPLRCPADADDAGDATLNAACDGAEAARDGAARLGLPIAAAIGTQLELVKRRETRG